MSVKKVVVIPSWYPTNKKPFHGIFFQEQSQALSRIYDVIIFLLPKLLWWRTAIATRFNLEDPIESRSGIKVYQGQVIVPPRLPKKIFPYFFDWATEKCFKDLLKCWGKPDLIQVHNIVPAGWIGMRLGKQHNIPVVLTEHSGPHRSDAQTDNDWYKIRTALKRVNKVVAVSPSLKSKIQDFQSGLDVSVVGNLTKTDYFTPDHHLKKEVNSQDKIHFLCISDLIREKGIHFLFEAAIQLIKRHFGNFQIIIGGNGPELSKLKSLAIESDIYYSHCQFLGDLTREEVKYWMQRCDVFVLPSLGETFGVVNIEAMACGKPVISTRCGGPEFVVTPETGILVPPADSESLANAMKGFITGQYKFESSIICKSVKDRFGEDAFLNNISMVYEEVWASNVSIS